MTLVSTKFLYYAPNNFCPAQENQIIQSSKHSKKHKNELNLFWMEQSLFPNNHK